MTHAQFDEWCAKDLVEPIGSRGTNDILVRLAVMIATKLGQEDVQPSAFAWWLHKEKDEAVSDDVAIAALQTMGAKRV